MSDRRSVRSARARVIAGPVVVGCRALLVLPPLVGAFSVLATPNYYRPMVEGVAGITILVLAALVLVAAYFLNEAGGSLLRSGRPYGFALNSECTPLAFAPHARYS